MLCILNDHVDPYFNLALEEYLLKEFNHECFMLWRNEPSIIIGKNQNTLAEINLEYVREHGIKVVRRLSGGGAVFHDLGNLNFTFIINDTQDSFCDFRKFTAPIIEVLAKLGIKAELSGRNDLTVSGLKFSGNAQFKHKDRLLHHGTILFSAAIPDITAALQVNPDKFEGKGIKSVASRVTNIQSHLSQPLTIEELEIMIRDHMASDRENYTLYSLTPMDIDKVNQLVQEKYATWEWNYGVSPRYNLRNKARIAGSSIEVLLDVKDGIIQNARIFGDFFSKCDISLIEESLVGVKHEEKAVTAVFSRFQFQDYIADVNVAEFINLLF
ncbi:MAG: lipoate--protein ligase [Bacillota bacterium]